MSTTSRVSIATLLVALFSVSCKGEDKPEAAPTPPKATVVAQAQAPSSTTPRAESPSPTPSAAPVPAEKGPIVGSCTIGGVACSEYQGGPSAPLKEQCLKFSGTWSDKGCPAAGRVGTCTKMEGPYRNATYSYRPGTAESSKLACKHTPGGVWSP